MESAIPQHLMMERTQPVGLRPDWQPPYPSFVARFAPSVTRVAMAYFGVQYRSEGEPPAIVRTTLADLTAASANAVRPSTSRFETLFSNDRIEGVAHLADALSGEVAEHAYWGGARDRLPLAQTNPLEPGSPPIVVDDGVQRVVRGQHNLCLIRSGQDWADTDGDERRMYLDEVEPVLIIDHAGDTPKQQRMPDRVMTRSPRETALSPGHRRRTPQRH